MASSSQPPPPPDPAIRSQPSEDDELAKMLHALVDPRASPPSNIITIHEADVYAQDPVDLTKQFPPTVAEDGREVWYFSTKLSQRGKRKRRSDSGVWQNEGKSKVVGVDGSEARRNLFSFMVDGARTGWINHEFRLPVPVLDGNEEVVLCKVFRSSRWCRPGPATATNNESAAAEVQAEAQAEVEVAVEEEARVNAVEEEARVNAVEAREAAVKVREEALPTREAAVAAREAAVAEREAAVAARDAADLQERQRDLAARAAALVAVLEGAAWQRRFPLFLAWGSLMLILVPARSLLQIQREAELAREAELREAESEALARREAARLVAEWERSLERERNLEAREFESIQEMAAYLMSDDEALVLIMMAAAALVARAGMRLLLPIAGGSRPAVAHGASVLKLSVPVLIRSTKEAYYM